MSMNTTGTCKDHMAFLVVMVAVVHVKSMFTKLRAILPNHACRPSSLIRKRD